MPFVYTSLGKTKSTKYPIPLVPRPCLAACGATKASSFFIDFKFAVTTALLHMAANLWLVATAL
ncbi:hypothetical protein D3C80_2148370 [compost metagenome]